MINLKRIIVLLLLLFSTTYLCSALELPDEPNQVVINKIDVEHKTTRQFVSNELSKKEEMFLNEFTKRADYYEESYENILRTAVWKLGLLWAGILFFFVSINKVITTKTEEKKYNVLKEALKNDIVRELKFENFKLPEAEIEQAKKLVETKMSSTKDKKQKGFFRRAFSKKEKPVKLSNRERDDILLNLRELISSQEKHNQFVGKQSLMDKMKSR